MSFERRAEKLMLREWIMMNLIERFPTSKLHCVSQWLFSSFVLVHWALVKLASSLAGNSLKSQQNTMQMAVELSAHTNATAKVNLLFQCPSTRNRLKESRPSLEKSWSPYITLLEIGWRFRNCHQQRQSDAQETTSAIVAVLPFDKLPNYSSSSWIPFKFEKWNCIIFLRNWLTKLSFFSLFKEPSLFLPKRWQLTKFPMTNLQIENLQQKMIQLNLNYDKLHLFCLNNCTLRFNCTQCLKSLYLVQANWAPKLMFKCSSNWAVCNQIYLAQIKLKTP